MREIRLFGSEGGVALTTPSLPLSKDRPRHLTADGADGADRRRFSYLYPVRLRSGPEPVEWLRVLRG